jgi:hypothetical protein
VPIAVRKIKAADHHAINGRLYISAVTIVGVARKPTAGLSRLLIAGEDGHAVPGFLTMPDGAIAGTLDLPAWKPRQTTITPAGDDVRFRSLRANICRPAPLGDFTKTPCRRVQGRCYTHRQRRSMVQSRFRDRMGMEKPHKNRVLS